MRALVALVIFFATPAWADGCDDLWFTRNLIMDRAGYCFGSRLGQSVFDNAGCAGKSVSLDPGAEKLVAEIRALEKHHGCKVDTSRTSLKLDDLDQRRRMRDLPIRDEFESGCIGWLEPKTPLYAGHDANAVAIGRIEPGDDVLFSHLGVPGWAYVTARAPGWGRLKSAGWLALTDLEHSCRQRAG